MLTMDGSSTRVNLEIKSPFFWDLRLELLVLVLELQARGTEQQEDSRRMNTSPSTKLGPALLIWINSLSSSLPSLSDLDDESGKPRRVVKQLNDLNDGVVLADVVGEVFVLLFNLVSFHSLLGSRSPGGALLGRVPDETGCVR